MPLIDVCTYSLPSMAVGFSFFILATYYMKFGTDVLLIAPATLSALYAAAKIWDGISDPIVGYLSDRTVSRFGRRRIWILVSAAPLSASLFLLWNPPALLFGPGLTIWVGFFLVVYFTSYTLFFVPHEAWGAELSIDHHDRTRIFGIKHMVHYAGNLLALPALYLFTVANDQREMAFGIMSVAACITLFALIYPVLRIKERADFQSRGEKKIFKAFSDVGANPHARIILFVFFIENLGTAVIATLSAFVIEYVVKMPNLLPVFFLLYLVPAVLFAPLWIKLSRIIGKKRLWTYSMYAMSIGFFGLFFVQEGGYLLLYALGAVAGIGGGCGQVVGPSIQADVIDYDELLTGQRKEGAYFAVWNFIRKAAFGIMVIITGIVLELVDFVPNAEQTEATKQGMLALYGLFPGLCYLIGAVLFSRFKLGEKECLEVRDRIAQGYQNN